MIKAVYMY